MTWSAAAAIRAHRERLGLSQSDVAASLGITKSLLSRIEAGERQPTDDQVATLAQLLGIPPDLLLVGSGRMPEDIREALDANAADVAAAVRGHTEAFAIVYPRTPASVPLPLHDLEQAAIASASLPKRIDVRKTSNAYRAHSYHTKVPPEAITPFIDAFTSAGDVVLDPFCGSGMTGVAALMSGRRALLSDLSPAAVHIARNYTSPCDTAEYVTALKRVEEVMRPTIDWLYRPAGSGTIVEYTTWSDVYRCGSCAKLIRFWDVVQRAGGADGDRIVCPHCGERFRKADLKWIGEEPVESNTSSGNRRIDTHGPTARELALIDEASVAPIPYWTPNVPFGSDREMWRAGHQAMGVESVAGFFTRRNLHALAALRHAIVAQCEGRVREALLFAFTASVNRASRRYQWNSKRPTNVMTGTLYISSLRYEWNVWSLFRRKAADVLRYYQSFPRSETEVQVFQRSATDLDCIPDRSVDMVFMDPPFGSNIFYADSSLLWEAWLGALTDETAEMVVNKHRSRAKGGKTLEDYEALIEQAFSQSARVLRRGGRAVLAFSNSDAQVWEAIQRALGDAGFDTDSVHLLSKGQPSIKGVKGVTGKEHVTSFDLLLCLKHRTQPVQMTVPFPPPPTMIDHTIRESLAAGGGRTDEMYSAVVRAVVESNYSVAGITMPMIAARCTLLGAQEKSGKWSWPDTFTKPTSNNDLVSGYLASTGSLPHSDGASAQSVPINGISISGGRNSAFYLAHSYHTKVPPEAIAPFIEHYTRPGDVILDPFCGSGMTGVAAALAGRRAILNDLSPAAVHLSWNHTRACDPQELANAFARVEANVATRFRALYQTTHRDGSPGTIHWTLWSTRHRCPRCSREFLLWDIMDRKTGRLGTTIKCPGCHRQVHRHELETLGSVPAWIAYETSTGKRYEKRPSPDDLKRALGFRRAKIRAPYPDVAIGPDREMYIRCALHLQGVQSLADFYTARNLEALAILWREIMQYPDERLRGALAFAFTNTAWHGTRMRRYNARGGQRPLTGTLYIPQLSSEANVLEVMRNKIGQLQRYYRSYRPAQVELPALLLGSATDLSAIPDQSIDYVFTDPPFGSNIFYADCNFIWESWLGRLTDPNPEAVVNRSLPLNSGGKSLETYSALIGGAMTEISRVLKPDGWATVVFHNTDGAVWQAIKTAAERAGFQFHEALSLERHQQSHKGYKGRSGTEDVAHFDVVFNLRKTTAVERANPSPAVSIDLRTLVAELLKDAKIASRGLQGVHAEVMRRVASGNGSAFVDYADVRTAWETLVNQSSPPTDLVRAKARIGARRMERRSQAAAGSRRLRRAQ